MKWKLFVTILLCLFLTWIPLQSEAQQTQCDSCAPGEACDPLGNGKEIVETFSGSTAATYEWINGEYKFNGEGPVFFGDQVHQAFGLDWDISSLGEVAAESRMEGDIERMEFTSQTCGIAKAHPTCNAVFFNPWIGPGIGESFTVTGVFDQVFDCSLLPGLDCFDYAWEGEWEVIAVRMCSDPQYGEYVCEIDWQHAGVIYAKMIDEDGDLSGACEDCDDNDSSLYLGAPELCDGKDNDCDGVIPVNEYDSDGDAYMPCEGDCDDSNGGINPEGIELPGNAIDENCDGSLGACDPNAEWKNHGQFVRCVAHETDALIEAGILTQEEGDALISSAAQSDVGKK
jgi:hypothetical protein